MALDLILAVFIPIIFIVIALAFDNRVMGFFGGASAFFVGLTYVTDVVWLGIVLIAMGLYFIVASVFMED